jgi:hypothetical protein
VNLKQIKHDDNAESAEERLARQFVEKLRAALGPLTTLGKARALGIALSQYTDRADHVARALVEAGGLQDIIVKDVEETIAAWAEEQALAMQDEAEEHVEEAQAHADALRYLIGLSAVVGAGF